MTQSERVAAVLDRLEHLAAGQGVEPEVIERARSRALHGVPQAGGDETATALAALRFASDLVTAAALNLPPDASESRRFVNGILDVVAAERIAPDAGIAMTVERRLARLRFDLHDGPQQDVHLLAMDLDLFREQLLPIVADHPDVERILGRLDDLSAQLVALDGGLRRLATSFQSPFLPPGSLPQALNEIADAFAARTGIEPQTRLAGDFDRLTESQQITILALVREALSNVRKHSHATRVTIAIESHSSGVEAQVVDDGRGFDPETTLVRAARDGHLGIVGMHERVRMLGGSTQIESRPGGPTVISASLPSFP